MPMEGLCRGSLLNPCAISRLQTNWGPSYRDYAKLELAQDKLNLSKVRLLLGHAVSAFLDSIAVAEGRQLKLQYVDSCEDLAQTFLLEGNIDDANSWLDKSYRAIPDAYRIREAAPTFGEIPKNERVESFWQMLGKIELTRAEILQFEYRKCKLDMSRDDWLYAMADHYVRAVAYFEHFSDEAKRLKDTLRRVYESFKDCSLQERSRLSEITIPRIEVKTGIDTKRLGKFFGYAWCCN